LKNEAIGILVAHHPGSGGKDKGAPECDTNEIMTITKNMLEETKQKQTTDAIYMIMGFLSS